MHARDCLTLYSCGPSRALGQRSISAFLQSEPRLWGVYARVTDAGLVLSKLYPRSLRGVGRYQRGYRRRAMRKLKTLVFKRDSSCPSDGSRREAAAPGASGGGSGDTPSGPGDQRGDHDVGNSEASATGRGEEATTTGAGRALVPATREGGAGKWMRGSAGHGSSDWRVEDDTCAICLDTYQDGDRLTVLPCRHAFHTGCIRPWLSGKSGVCPMCKREAFPPRGRFVAAMAPRIEMAFEELTALCTDNLVVLGTFFLASVACGVAAAHIFVRD